MLLTLLIPCHNEAEALPALFAELAHLKDWLLPEIFPEILLVDDGSFDNTLEQLGNFADDFLLPVRVLGLRPQAGLGAAIREAVPLASGEVVVTYDADLPYPLSDIRKLVDPIHAGEADVVTASPWHPEGNAPGVPPHRLLLSRTLSALYRLRLGKGAQGLHTFTCGFRAYRKSTLLEVLPRRDDFTATAEMLVRSLKAGARVLEVPSTLRGRTDGVSKMRIVRTALAHVGLLMRGG